MQQWEYLVTDNESKGFWPSNRKIQDWLNEMGRLGWQLVFVYSDGAHVFKKPK